MPRQLRSALRRLLSLGGLHPEGFQLLAQLRELPCACGHVRRGLFPGRRERADLGPGLGEALLRRFSLLARRIQGRVALGGPGGQGGNRGLQLARLRGLLRQRILRRGQRLLPRGDLLVELELVRSLLLFERLERALRGGEGFLAAG